MNSEEQKPESLKKEHFFMGDKLAENLVVTLGWSPLRTGITAYLIAISLSLIIALISRTFFSGSNYVGLFNDGFYWISETILIPTLWGYYRWIIDAPYHVLRGLEASGVILLNKETNQEINNFLKKKHFNKAALILGIIAGIAYFLQHYYADPLWFNTNLILLSLRVLVVIIPTGYVAWEFIMRLILNARLFRKMLRDVTLHPLHPDKAGGLRPLGKYALSTTYIIAFAGSILALGEYIWYIRGDFEHAYFFHIALILYLVFAPLAFFAPLFGAHAAMRRAKENFIARISRQFNRDYSKAYNEIDESAEVLKASIEKIEQLQNLYKLTREFPVWPFDSEILRRFMLTFSAPILTIIITIIAQYITNLLLR